MRTFPAIDAHVKAVVFGLDDVLFPARDYLLQVYYLFANLLEYTATAPPAKELTEFLKATYDRHGQAGLFDRAVEVFAIDTKYKEAFDRLHVTAQLPLKVLLYERMAELMHALSDGGKQLVILAEGNPVMQLNKLRQVEWRGLDRVIKVYFEEELRAKQLDPMRYLIADIGLQPTEILHIGTEEPSYGIDIAWIAANRFRES